MAERKQPELVPDPLVQALIPDPAAGSPRAVVLNGFLGPSTSAGEWRLYLTRTLDHYVVLPEDRILHTHRLSDERGTLVWVPQDLELKASGPEPVAPAKFLGGSIVADNLAAATLTPYTDTNAGPMLVRYATINPSGVTCRTSGPVCDIPGNLPK